MGAPSAQPADYHVAYETQAVGQPEQMGGLAAKPQHLSEGHGASAVTDMLRKESFPKLGDQLQVEGAAAAIEPTDDPAYGLLLGIE